MRVPSEVPGTEASTAQSTATVRPQILVIHWTGLDVGLGQQRNIGGSPKQVHDHSPPPQKEKRLLKK